MGMILLSLPYQATFLQDLCISIAVPQDCCLKEICSTVESRLLSLHNAHSCDPWQIVPKLGDATFVHGNHECALILYSFFAQFLLRTLRVCYGSRPHSNALVFGATMSL